MKKTSSRNVPAGIRYAWPILGVILLGGAIAAAVYLSGQNQSLQGKAAVEPPCTPNPDGECITALPVAAQQTATAALPVNEYCKDPVYLTVDYKHVGCIGNQPCDGYVEGSLPTTAVGWKSKLAESGPAIKMTGNSIKIPLTDVNGKVIKDNPVWRTSSLFTALGITRLGNRQVVISHQNANNSYAEQKLKKSFQGIDAVMTLEGAVISGYAKGDNGAAPDQPVCLGGEPTSWCKPGQIVYHGLDLESDGKISEWKSGYKNLAPAIGPCGGDEKKLTIGTKSWQHYSRVCWPGDDYVVTFKCEPKPQPVACNLYPIALNKTSVDGKAIGTQLTDIWNGSGNGNFGWLTWAGSTSEPTLSTSLTPQGDSKTYINPKNPQDHTISVGDMIKGRPGVTNSIGVRTALDKLKTQDIVVPVWDTNTCAGGANAQYRTWKYAKVRITGYDLAGGPANGPAGTCNEKPGMNKISATFKGYVDCIQ